MRASERAELQAIIQELRWAKQLYDGFHLGTNVLQYQITRLTRLISK